ncbi:MAG: hypothetical protein ACPG9K_00975 [Poseidonibacter sp.]
MKQIEKEYLVLANHFFKIWAEDSDVKRTKFKALINELNRGMGLEFDKREIPAVLESAFNKLIKITNNTEVTANAIVLSVGCISLLYNNGFFKGSKNISIKRLIMDVYNEVEEKEKLIAGFKNANILISKLEDFNDEDTNQS